VVIAVWFFVSAGRLGIFFLNAQKLTSFPFGTRTYVVLFQNNAELRPGGGFISMYGTVKFTGGFISDIQLHDSYGDINKFRNNKFPEGMDEIFADNWNGYSFKDANFQTDFRDNIDDLVVFLDETNKSKIHGIVTVDWEVLEDLLQFYGPITINKFEFNSNNVYSLLNAAINDVDKYNQDQFVHRKDIAEELFIKLKAKAIRHPMRIEGLSHILTKNLDEKHITINTQFKSLQKRIHKNNWDGQMQDISNANTDGLAIIEANIDKTAANRHLTRDIDYLVEFDDKLRANLNLTLTHNGEENYKGYIRLFIPQSAEFKESNIENFRTEKTKGWRGFGYMIELKPGEAKTISLQYNLPADFISNGQYNLLLRKQPGTNSDQYRIRLKNTNDSSFAAQHFSIQENIAVLDTSLDKDVILSASLIADTSPPYLMNYYFNGLEELVLDFNEKTDIKTWKQKNPIQIEDLNVANRTKDKIEIKKITLSDKEVHIDIEGMSKQALEKYIITLKSITDQSGNFLDPNPKIITILQD